MGNSTFSSTDFALPHTKRSHNLYDKEKDPKGHFVKMVAYFTSERISNKKLSKQSKTRYYSDLEKSQKIFINSAYGFMGASGLLFNSPDIASQITRSKGRLPSRLPCT